MTWEDYPDAPDAPLLLALRALTNIGHEVDEHYTALWRREEHVDLDSLVVLGQQVEQARLELAAFLDRIKSDMKPFLGERETETSFGVVTCRYSVKRSQWDHDELWRRVVALAVEQPGVLTDEDGEILPPAVIGQNIAAVLRSAASPSWKVTGLRALGVDPSEWCVEEPAVPTITLPKKVTT